MNWEQYFNRLNSLNRNRKFQFNSPARSFLIEELKERMNLSELPASLIELYKQTNGVTELMDDKAIGEIVWQIERVIETNLSYRSNGDFAHLYMAFDQLFFFSDAGNGDLFAFITLNGRFERDDIFVWNHENDSRTWIASNLEKFLAGWIDGSIQV